MNILLLRKKKIYVFRLKYFWSSVKVGFKRFKVGIDRVDVSLLADMKPSSTFNYF